MTAAAGSPRRRPGGVPLQESLGRVLVRFAAETGTVHRLDPDGFLRLQARAGSIPDALLPVIRRIPVGKGMAGLAAERGEPVQICNLQTDDSGDARPGARSTGMGGSICVPIAREGRVVGVLGVAVAREREFSREEAAALARAGAELAGELR